MQGSNSCQTQKKMSFKSHVYFEPVRPRIVRAALDFLQRVNSLFCDPLIRDGNINHIIYSFLRIWSHLLKKSLMENIFCAVNYAEKTCRTLHCLSGRYKLLKDLMQSICYIADRFIKDTLEKVNTECL